MNGREIIKAIMRKNNVSNAELAKKLKITPAALWDRIDTQPRKNKPRKDIPVSLLSEMIEVMGYKVIVVPTETFVPDDGFIINCSVSDKTITPTDSEDTEKLKTRKRIPLT